MDSSSHIVEEIVQHKRIDMVYPVIRLPDLPRCEELITKFLLWDVYIVEKYTRNSYLWANYIILVMS